MGKLTLAQNLDDGDEFFSSLLALHDGLTDDESLALSARLILLLANHIGDRGVLEEALEAARQT